MNIFEIMQKKWDSERVTDEFRHIKINETIISSYEKYLKNIDLKGKTIIDYGCGGGHLGVWLFEEKGIKKYIGFDISEISVKAAKENLKNYKAKIYQIKEHVDFSKYKADVFITLECIQHFPTKGYLINFLKSVNDSGINELLIQYRFGRGVSFNYKNVMTWMCKLPKGYIEKHLLNYRGISKDESIGDNIKKEWIYFNRDLVGKNEEIFFNDKKLEPVESEKHIGIEDKEELPNVKERPNDLLFTAEDEAREIAENSINQIREKNNDTGEITEI